MKFQFVCAGPAVSADQAQIEPAPRVVGVGHIALVVQVGAKRPRMINLPRKGGRVRLIFEVDQQVVGFNSAIAIYSQDQLIAFHGSDESVP